ncbi:MAG: L-lactate dehydrogenase [Ruminococcaceae bacterium]|nr:L-lactate dehydrogenase [Oscillospiraceae bacterium]
MNKITIIGAGNVGATIAYTLTISGLASRIVLIDINEEKALGEARDILQGTPYFHPCDIYAGTYADAKDSNIVIITSGVARKPGQSRLDLAQVNVDILKQITPQITKYAPNANYIIVSNPVDILTYAFCKYSGLPENRIIGSGTILDTARLRSCISDYYDINQQNVHAFVLGEHGDSSFIPWSVCNISNIPIDEYCAALTKPNKPIHTLSHQEIEDHVRTSGAYIIQRKGATFHAVSMSVAYICKGLLSGIDTTMPVSTMLHGEYGIDDVCLSLLNVVGHDGAHSHALLRLNDEEMKALHHSADSLKAVIKSVTF